VFARAVVAGKEQLEFFSGRPALADAELPGEAPQLDQGADPGDERNPSCAGSAGGHDDAPRGIRGQGFAGYLNLLARLNCKSGYAYEENLAGASPISFTTRELSNTVFQSRYGQKTFARKLHSQPAAFEG